MKVKNLLQALAEVIYMAASSASEPLNSCLDKYIFTHICWGKGHSISIAMQNAKYIIWAWNIPWKILVPLNSTLWEISLPYASQKSHLFSLKPM